MALKPCKPWDGAVNRDGYGRWGWGLAHRRVYEEEVGEIPVGMTLDHICHNEDVACPGGRCPHRLCVEISHLEVISQSENSHRRWRKARAYA